MSLRDDVRWIRDVADSLLIGALPGRPPKWSTREGEQLAWLVMLLWRKYVDAAMARSGLEAEITRLKGDVDGLRDTNERLTDLLDEPEREAAVAALVGHPTEPGYYWVRYKGAEDAELAHWDGESWWFCDSADVLPKDASVASGPVRAPSVPQLSGSALESTVARLKVELEGVRELHVRLTEKLDQSEREEAATALAGDDRPEGHYWVEHEPGRSPEVALWAGHGWWFPGMSKEIERVHLVLSGRVSPPRRNDAP